MKKILLLTLFTVSFFSCTENEILETLPAQILGEWEMYRNEKQESVIDQWTETEWTYKNQWFKTIRNSSKIILAFNEDGTFENRYADVVIANGTWEKIAENQYSFVYTQDAATKNDAFKETRFVTFYCDKTYSVTTEGDTNTINYFQQMGTTACSSLIKYKVTD
jgi:hypothetical protein